MCIVGAADHGRSIMRGCTPDSALMADGRPVVAVFRAPVFNASETFVQEQASGLRRYQPLVVGLEDKGNVSPALEGRIWLPNGPIAATYTKLTGRSGWIARRLQDFHPAVVHAHFAQDGLTALGLARRLGVPLVTSLRGHDLMRSRASQLFSGQPSWMAYALRRKRLMREGALFLTECDVLRTAAIRQGFPEDRVLTHYHGVDMSRFDGARNRVEEGLILHVGKLVEKKGTADLIDAFTRVVVHRPDARLVIVGDGPLRPFLEAQADKAGMRERIQFTGVLPAEAVAAWLARAAIVAIPSRTAHDGDAEGFPNIALEASAAACPVVATRHMGLREAVIDAKTGLLVREGSIAALSDALLYLLASPRRAAALGEAGRALMVSRFAFADQMERLEGLYDTLRAGGVPMA